MKKIKVFETFAGIGAQRKALEILNEKKNIPYEIVGTSEWDIRTNISYDAIHDIKKAKEKKETTKSWKISGHSINKYSHSFNTKTPFSKIYSLEEKYNGNIVDLLESSFANNKNQGSIVKINGDSLIDEIGKFDLLTYSFPCQDLSTAGGFHHGNKGMKKGSGTRSGLLWEIERIITELEIKGAKEKDKYKYLPKYLLLENVKNMLSEKHISDYIMWLKRLNELGYSTQTFLLNAKDFGIPQNRERVYAISVLDSKDFTDTYNSRKSNPKFKTSREKIIEESAKIKNISKELGISKKLKDILKLDYSNKKYRNEAIEAVANSTDSRYRMKFDNPYLYMFGHNADETFKKLSPQMKKLYKKSKKPDGWFREISRTVTTKQDRSPNSGIIQIDDDLRRKAKDATGRSKETYRFLTPREAFLLMGFLEKDFDNVKKLGMQCGINNEILYREAGNSIVVNVLCSIFNYMFKF